MAEENKPTNGKTLEGEGSYTATRRYNRHLAEHQQKEDVEALAEEALEALESDEAEELARAEQQGKRGPKPQPSAEKKP